MDRKLIIGIFIVFLIIIIFAIACVKIQDIVGDTEETPIEFWTRVLIVFVTEILCISVAIIVYLIVSKLSSRSSSNSYESNAQDFASVKSMNTGIDTAVDQPAPTMFETSNTIGERNMH